MRTSIVQFYKMWRANEKWKTASYLPWKTHLEWTIWIHNTNILFVFVALCNVQSIFTRLDHVPLLQKSGLHDIQCSDCPTVYVRQTGRRSETRLSEHEYALAKRTLEKSHFASYLLFENHLFSWEIQALDSSMRWIEARNSQLWKKRKLWMEPWT